MSHVDLLPTLLDIAKTDPSIEALDGVSLLAPAKDNIVFAESMSDGIEKPVYMIRQHQYKFIFSEMQSEMLYDLSADPHEQTNIANQNPALVTRFKKLVTENWNSDDLQNSIDQSISRRLLIRDSHLAGASPEWDHMPQHPDNHKWCRSGSDYTVWSTSVN